MCSTKISLNILTQKRDYTIVKHEYICLSCDNSWNVKGKGKYNNQFIYLDGKMKGINEGLVGVPRICRRFLKFAYVVVRV